MKGVAAPLIGPAIIALGAAQGGSLVASRPSLRTSKRAHARRLGYCPALTWTAGLEDKEGGGVSFNRNKRMRAGCSLGLLLLLIVMRSAHAQIPLTDIREPLRAKARILIIGIYESRMLGTCSELYPGVPAFGNADRLLSPVITRAKAAFSREEQQIIWAAADTTYKAALPLLTTRTDAFSECSALAQHVGLQVAGQFFESEGSK